MKIFQEFLCDETIFSMRFASSISSSLPHFTYLAPSLSVCPRCMQLTWLIFVILPAHKTATRTFCIFAYRNRTIIRVDLCDSWHVVPSLSYLDSDSFVIMCTANVCWLVAVWVHENSQFPVNRFNVWIRMSTIFAAVSFLFFFSLFFLIFFSCFALLP